MGKSYRKPYATVTGSNSAKEDKRLANRSVRRLQDRSLREAEDWEEYLVPHRYEASHNDVWGWQRDGKPRLHYEPTWNDVLHWFHNGRFTDEQAMEHALESFEYQKKYYTKLTRK